MNPLLSAFPRLLVRREARRTAAEAAALPSNFNCVVSVRWLRWNLREWGSSCVRGLTRSETRNECRAGVLAGTIPLKWGAHASRVLLTASRRQLRTHHLGPPFSFGKMVRRSLRRDAANHTPEACAPLFQLHRSGLVLQLGEDNEQYHANNRQDDDCADDEHLVGLVALFGESLAGGIETWRTRSFGKLVQIDSARDDHG
jgi:hypothetical protein